MRLERSPFAAPWTGYHRSRPRNDAN